MRLLLLERESCETYASSLFNVICCTGAVEDTPRLLCNTVPNAPVATAGCQAECSSGLPFSMPEPGRPWQPIGPPPDGSKSATGGPVQLQTEHDPPSRPIAANDRLAAFPENAPCKGMRPPRVKVWNGSRAALRTGYQAYGLHH